MVLLLSEATTLAHAMTASLARASGIRLLSIKGPVADHYGLRPPRIPADADVWVDPYRFDDFRLLLEARGWHLRVGRETPSLLPQHSFTYIHPAWPCDIDVHWMFPGFFADPQAAFDVVWAGRSDLEIAHVPVTIPSLAGAAVIGVLHALRNIQVARNEDERARIASMLNHQMSEEDRAEFYRIARAGGALWVLRDVIAESRLGDAVSDLTADQKRHWTLFQEYVEDGSAVSWWVQLRSSSWLDKGRLLGRALWVPRVDVPRNDPGMVPTRAEAWTYQRARWARGARSLMRYFRKERRRARG